MNKKILALNGSPHKNGMSAKMISCAVSEAEKHGDKVKAFDLYDLNIAYCKGCRKCGDIEKCVFHDDIDTLYDEIKNCDIIILSAPTYWANVPACVKNIFDRLVGAAMDNRKMIPKPRFTDKQKYLIMTSCDTPFPFSYIFGQANGTLKAMKEFFKTSGMKKLGSISVSSSRKYDSLPKSAENKIRRFLSK